MFSSKLSLIIGPMFAGKTTELLRRIRRHKISGYNCLLIKYAKDDRYSKDAVFTHDNDQIDAIACNELAEVEVHAKHFDVIGIDEGQFFKDIVKFSDSMANKGKIVIVAALNGTFERKSFGDIPSLLPLAEEISKLTAICMECKSDASFTIRTTSSKETTLIGGAEHYRPVCRSCFVKHTAQQEFCNTENYNKDIKGEFQENFSSRTDKNIL